ncbi:MAG: hypothetical protein ACRD9W_05175, partial [Terriglobia bacterium]
MKALLATATTVRVGKDRTYCYLTVQLPVEQAEHAKRLFRGKRVLVTLADAETAAAPDGIKAGN